MPILLRLSVLILSAALAIVLQPPGEADAALDVWGDDAADRYIGSGALLLPPGSADDAQRRSAAACRGCEWAASSMCVLADGSFPPGPGAPDCTPTPARCADTSERLVLWRGGPGGPGWQRSGTFCWTQAGPPMTTDRLAGLLRDRFLRELPAPVPRSQPTAAALMNLPVVFADDSGAGPTQWTESLLGLTVTLTAEPRWSWSFGAGTTLRGGPGGAYPDVSVARTSRAPGDYRVDVEIAWPASYSVAGLGTYPIPEVVRTAGSTTVEVRAARAVLTHRE